MEILPHLIIVPGSADQEKLYELSWASSPGATLVLDIGSGEVIAANPAAESLFMYSHGGLVGLHLTRLHPEAERERVKAELLQSVEEPLFHFGFHIQSNVVPSAPVVVRSSKSATVGGRSVKVCFYRDISDLEQREHLLATKQWALSAYAGAALAMSEKRTVKSFLESICEAITRESVYVLAGVVMAESGENKAVRIEAEAGSAKGYLNGLSLSWSEDRPDGNGPVGTSLRTGTVQQIEDSEENPSFEPFRDQARRYGIRSNVSIPFSFENDRYGALAVYAAHPRAFEPLAVEVFRHLAEQIGNGIHSIEQEKRLLDEQMQSTKMRMQLTEALSAMVSPIIAAMELRDPYTAGHQSRVAHIAVAIGKEMGWPEERIVGLRVAAQVHDIGKISVPVEILSKPGQLNAIERLMVNAHSETGHTILRGIPFAWPIAEIVRQHHEKLDGSGYPFGLKGDEILPEAKVLAVADIVEALISDRPYRRAMDLKVVLEEIESQSGRLLDPEAVRICAMLFREGRLCVPISKPGQV
jgi:PAS domain S-box-containing protein